MSTPFLVTEYEACNPEARQCTVPGCKDEDLHPLADWRMCRTHYFATSEVAHNESLKDEVVKMDISVGCMVRREGRPDLGVGDVAEINVGEIAGLTARVNWPVLGHGTVEKLSDLRRDMSAETERGNQYLSDG